MNGGASPAADAGAPEPRRPLSTRLIGRGSLAGAVVILAVALLYVVVLPAIAGTMSAPAEPRVIPLGGGATVTAAEGDWEVSGTEGGVTTLTHAGATLVIGAPEESDRLPAEDIEELIDVWLAEASAAAVATAPRAFETDAGDRAATVVLTDATVTLQAWVVSDGSLAVPFAMTAPSNTWEAASTSAQLLVRSLEFAEEAP